MKLKHVLIVTGLLSMVMGLVYLLGFFGSTEGEVKNWAMLSILAGLLSAGFSHSNFHRTWITVLAVFGYGLLLIAQALPIYMWFNAPMLTDKQSNFVISYWYSIPHFLVAFFALWSIVKILKK